MKPSSLLEVRGLTMRFGGIVANNDVSFDVADGSITALIGPNGAGKTTVFNCLTGFYRASGGTIHLATAAGAPVEVGSLLDKPFIGGSYLVARAGIARTFQNIRLFREMSVVENLLVAQHQRLDRNVLAGALGTRKFRQTERDGLARAFHWLEVMGLTADANRLAGELPYGRQRRLEIARAMCTGPRLVCLDEPAAGLNPRETHELSELIRTLRSEHRVTVLLIEHDMSLVMGISEHIVVLDHGEVIAAGNPETIRSSPAVIAAYLGAEEAEVEGGEGTR
ncbi:ATP-binding cassette domain-containing protein [Plasticicumulans sp.]|uniref:ATP-binding cassette domain-containing protein n=1 Tax=Plasticicumulans sp. TaxID=2307179 RepID=UPI000FAC53E5|nr:ATP-binding cassette domain-containing protein [Plasticicumulans sp.]MBS0600741.1 ATP-binding cassette domain-containing protein [Pseudomonadota bacterium]RTL01786.1 MAG: ATP-binding cassette domain-containing protein [Xanthomonadales bacterium]HMV38484.1 ATP-binding cassette domain-containing protein [Plasticicumulans sp.]HMW30207.1 ATP-binding cassette domain-containing protein [Plasticicumulans sp.]HMW42503.1 ATP-binding cassette domain-containing protein [Plasticicumulans sp.]